jgi:uncharacterized cupin superfamily protein
MFDKVEEAPLAPTPAGLAPGGDGWYIVNVAEAAGSRSPVLGGSVKLAGYREDDWTSPDLAVNIRVLEPGVPNARYHRENIDEAFLVLRGECLVVVEEQERPLRKGDFLFAPAGTAHVFVGAGEGPCAILMVSRRVAEEDEALEYPASEVAARYGASASKTTASPEEAYAGFPERTPAPLGELF